MQRCQFPIQLGFKFHVLPAEDSVCGAAARLINLAWPGLPVINAVQLHEIHAAIPRARRVRAGERLEFGYQERFCKGATHPSTIDFGLRVVDRSDNNIFGVRGQFLVDPQAPRVNSPTDIEKPMADLQYWMACAINYLETVAHAAASLLATPTCSPDRLLIGMAHAQLFPVPRSLRFEGGMGAPAKVPGGPPTLYYELEALLHDERPFPPIQIDRTDVIDTTQEVLVRAFEVHGRPSGKVLRLGSSRRTHVDVIVPRPNCAEDFLGLPRRVPGWSKDRPGTPSSCRFAASNAVPRATAPSFHRLRPFRRSECRN